MKYFYLDASALAKRYAPETGSSIVDHLFTRVPPARLIVSALGLAEVASILVRKHDSGKLSTANLSQVLIDFKVEITSVAAIKKVTADLTLIVAAISLIVQHSLNATNAILLCSAIDLTIDLSARGDDLVLVASDDRLLRAAQAEGLLFFNPEIQTTADLDQLLV